MSSILQTYGYLFVQAITVGIILVIRFNDVSHLKEDVKKLWDEIKELRRETSEQGERLAKIEGRLNGEK